MRLINKTFYNLIFSGMQEPKKMRPVFFNVTKSIQKRQNIFQQSQTCSKLSEDNIKNSMMYNKLNKRLQKLQETQHNQIQQYQKNMEMLDKMIQIAKSKIYSLKYENWELRNETMQLQDHLQEEISINEQLQNEQKYNQYQESEQDNQQQRTESQGTQSQEFKSSYNLSHENSDKTDINYQASSNSSKDESNIIVLKKQCSIKNLLPSEITIHDQSNTNKFLDSFPISEISQMSEQYCGGSCN